MCTIFRCINIRTIASASSPVAQESYPVAEDAYERLISLPMFHSMTAQDVEDVIHAVGKVLEHYEKRVVGR
jgi:dTDP-4-amino-4,6-dideoxygalactose transaminase